MEMSIGDGMKLVISGGAVSPPYPFTAPVQVENPTDPSKVV
jgi:uncharacterized membrane protein